MTGVTGEYMGFLPKTVSIALCASLVVALIANPLILSLFIKRTVKKGRIVRPEDDLRRLKRIYVRGVSWALNHRGRVIVIILVCLAAALSLPAMNLVKVDMFPDADFDFIYITVETPRGTEIDVTDAAARRVEEIVRTHVPEAVQVVATVGERGQSAMELSYGTGTISNFAEITVELIDSKEVARISHHEIQDRVRPHLERIPGADVRFRPMEWGPPLAAPVLVRVIGPEIEVLRRITARTREIMAAIPGVVDIKDDFADAAPELRVTVDRERAAVLGIPLEALAISLRGATAGLDIREFRDELDVSRKYDLKLRFAPEARTSPRMLDSVKVRSDSGELVSLAAVATFSHGEGLNSIRHTDRHRIVRISASNRGRSAVEITTELMGKLNDMQLPQGYRFDFSGEYKQTAESFESLRLAYVVAAILIFSLLVSQFNSLAQPFAILTALPLSVIGAIAGLYLTGNDFTITSFVGLVGLSGIVVNDSIVLVDCINRMRASGMRMFDAIVAGGQQRLRPIISTTLSTVGGILTLTITDKLWEGLGVVIIFGIIFATVLTLVVVPVMYSIFEGMRYYVISAFRGPRWSEKTEGRCFCYSRRRWARTGIAVVAAVQVPILVFGCIQLVPQLAERVAATSLQAPSLLKLTIETVVFAIGVVLQAGGWLALLLLPTFASLVLFMARRSREGYCVDVTPGGITVSSPVDRYFLERDEISSVSTPSLFPLIPAIRIHAGGRRIVLRKLIETDLYSGKAPLWGWLAGKAPSKGEVRRNMLALKEALDDLCTGDRRS